MTNFLSTQLSAWVLLLLAGDLVVFAISVMLGLWLQPLVGGASWFFWEYDKFLLLLLGVTYITVLYIADLYDQYLDFRARENFSRVILSALCGTLLVALLFYYLWGHFLARKFIEWQGLFFVWLLVLWRYSFSAVALPQRLRRRVLIVGAGRAGTAILEVIRQRPNSGLAVAGFVDDDPRKIGRIISDTKVLGDTQSLTEIIVAYKIGLVVVAITSGRPHKLVTTLTSLSFAGCQVTDMPSLYEFLSGKVPLDHISGEWFAISSHGKNPIFYRHIKRLLDLASAIAGLLLTWPFFFIFALAIKLDTPGPVFFRQHRLGRGGKPFQIFKFRTMFKDAGHGDPTWTTDNDPRITRVGRFLRKFRLDELPQLINIIKGEMSLIGPRAEWDVFAEAAQEQVPILVPGRRASDPLGAMVTCGYREKLPYYSARLVVRPGITGWAQVMFPHAGSSDEDLKEKLQYDLYYIKNMGIFLDIAILLKTIRIVLFGRGK